MTRVLLVEGYGARGGAESWTLQLLDATDRLRPEVVVLRAGSPFAAAARERGWPVVAELPTGASAAALAAANVRLAAVLRRSRPPVVVADGTKAAAAALPAARLARVRSVWVKHDHGFDGRLTRLLGRLATAVVGTAAEVLDAVGRPDAVVIEPPRPAGPVAGRAAARRTLAAAGAPARDGRLVLGMVGRLAPFKGAEDALRALARPEAAAWDLVVVGDDDYAAPGEAARLRALADTLGLGERVVLPGRLAEPERWIGAFDAVAVLTRPAPGTPGREGFGMVALEAMLAGVPVVAVGGGAIERRLAGQAGVVVPPGDPAAVARALATLADPAARAAMGAAGRRLTAAHPDAATAAARLAALVERVAGGAA